MEIRSVSDRGRHCAPTALWQSFVLFEILFIAIHLFRSLLYIQSKMRFLFYIFFYVYIYLFILGGGAVAEWLSVFVY